MIMRKLSLTLKLRYAYERWIFSVHARAYI